MRRRVKTWMLLGMVVAALTVLPASMVQAQPMPAGAVVAMTGVDDASATVWDWISGKLPTIVGALMMFGGLGTMASGYMGSGGILAGVGAAVPFVPSISSTGVQAVPAATVATAGAFTPVPLWLPMPQDPVFLLAMGVALALLCARAGTLRRLA